MILGNFVGYLGVESMSKLNKQSINFKKVYMDYGPRMASTVRLKLSLKIIVEDLVKSITRRLPVEVYTVSKTK